jgi:hypothetical protein
VNRLLRRFFIGLTVVQIGVALGFCFQVPFIVALFPLPYSDSINPIFLGSILLAAAASAGWCLWTRSDGALSGVMLDYVTIFVPLGIYGWQLYSERPTSVMLVFVMVSVVAVVFGAAMFLYTVRIPIPKSPPMPRLVRISFLIFVVGLIFFGGQMVLRTPGILPWQTTSATIIIYGWMFIGAASYFAYGLLRPSWHNAGGQLAGFLAYDLVLIIPFLLLLPEISRQRLPNLIIYLVFLSYSGLLAIYYLFINRETRLFSLKK